MAKDYFSTAAIEKAVQDIPLKGNKDLKMLLARVNKEIGLRSEGGETVHLQSYVAAVEHELERRPIEVDADGAKHHAAAAVKAADMTLYEATRSAFESIPASDYEMRFLPILAENPGSFSKIKKLYGKGDINLCVGCIVDDRYGWFRHLQSDHSDLSTIVIEKEKKMGLVHYRLRPEAETAFREMGLI